MTTTEIKMFCCYIVNLMAKQCVINIINPLNNFFSLKIMILITFVKMCVYREYNFPFDLPDKVH